MTIAVGREFFPTLAPKAGDEGGAASNNICRPYGTLVHVARYPALKRWAKLYRASGAVVFGDSFQDCNASLVHTDTLEPLVSVSGFLAGQKASASIECNRSKLSLICIRQEYSCR